MGKIIYSHKLEYELNELVVILYYKQYFGFKKDAIEYVQHIRDFIDTISTRPIKLCKSPKYGKYYARYDNKKSNMQHFIPTIQWMKYSISKTLFHAKRKSTQPF